MRADGIAIDYSGWEHGGLVECGMGKWECEWARGMNMDWNVDKKDEEYEDESDQVSMCVNQDMQKA